MTIVINSIERPMQNGEVNILEFVNSIGSAGETFELPGKYHDFRIRNLGDQPIYVTLPPYFRNRVRPGQERHFQRVSAASVSIKAEAGNQGFQVTATRYGMLSLKLEPPDLTDFNWAEQPATIYTNAKGQYDTDLDVSSYKPDLGANKTYYVDVANGSDNNTGTSLASAFATIKKATDKTDAGEILLAEGIYNRVSAFVNAAVTKSGGLSIKALPGHEVRIVNCSPQTWVQHGTYLNVYSSTVTAKAEVYDDKYIDDNGDMLGYTRAADIPTVSANPGSFYVTGSTVYISTIDGRTPDDQIIAFKDQLNANFQDGTFYFEGISFEGGFNGACYIGKSTKNPKAYFKNCQFRYATNDDSSAGGLMVLGASEVFLQNCEAARNINDGFNYHIGTGAIANVVEINCVGRDNGVFDDVDNGSTMHDGGKIMRLNGFYPRNKGSNVGDINPGTQSWNVGLVSEGSTASAAEKRYNSNYTAHEGAKVILEGCESHGSLNDYTAQDEGVIMLRGFKPGNGGRTFEGTGRIINY